ncbi:hypothetical protein [Microvirga sp. M2]|uniref:hypothetical protein n=1 Tax=Microvirga sp. M2 TaxID=3073270 RepID=UPI0039C1D30C
MIVRNHGSHDAVVLGPQVSNADAGLRTGLPEFSRKTGSLDQSLGALALSFGRVVLVSKAPGRDALLALNPPLPSL